MITMPSSRRMFLTSASAASYRRILGANERVQVGFIGCGVVARRHLQDFKNQKDVQLAAMCDVYRPRFEQAIADFEPGAKGCQDFRRVLESKDIQAVVVSTPDHWHALISIMACAAGKDVYVEKPMTVFVKEGRWMIEAARRYQRVVQVGTQQRSGPHYRKAAQEILPGGYIGKILSVRVAGFRNVMPGFGNPPDSAPPPDMDYDLWLGPAPQRPYNPNRSLYHFRWFWDYSGGQMTNLGVHEMDIVLWALKAKGPTAVSSSGGRFGCEDNGEVPDTQDALLEFPHCNVLFSYREASTGHNGGTGLEFLGTKGSMKISRSGYQVLPDMKMPPGGAVPVYVGQPAIPRNGPQHLFERPKPEPWIEPLEASGSELEQFSLHARNFIDCVKSRQRPNADVEFGHQATAACHLANISLRTGRKLRWDPEKEEILGDREASACLVRPYRKPWDRELRSLGFGG